MQYVKISSIKINPANPRIIKDAEYRTLVRSVAQFPAMLGVRGMVVDSQKMIIGGNQRWRAIRDLMEMPESDLRQACGENEAAFIMWEMLREKKAVPESWILDASNFTPDEIQRFIIADNVEAGEHDWDELANGWDVEKLADWGLEVPGLEDYSGKNKEIYTDDMADEMVLSFKFQPEQYFEVKAALEEIAETPEAALLTLLENARTQVSV